MASNALEPAMTMQAMGGESSVGGLVQWVREQRGKACRPYPFRKWVLLQEWLAICDNERDSIDPRSSETGHERFPSV